MDALSGHDLSQNFHAEQQLYGDMFPQSPFPATQHSNELFPESTSLEEIAHSLPNREQCQVLVWAYFVGYHTMKPLFNGPSFLKQAHEFCLW